MAPTVRDIYQYLEPAFEAAYPEIAALSVFERNNHFFLEVLPTHQKGFGVMIDNQSPKDLILMQIGIIHEILDRL